MSYETILYDEQDNVATLTFNRPATLNAFTDKMIAETTRAVRHCGGAAGVRCLVLTGSGRAFSSGQDLGQIQAKGEEFSIGDHIRESYNRLIQAMMSLEKPIVGSINGVAAGAGCGVALATDFRIASHTASFMLAFSKVGLIPDSGTNWFLPRLIGQARAYEMAITADKVPAEIALEWGLVNRVVPSAQLAETTRAWALRLAAGPTLAYGLTKRAMTRAWGINLEQALTYEARLQEIASRSRDSREGVSAFLEKRPARFEGR